MEKKSYRFIELRRDPSGNVTVKMVGSPELTDKIKRMSAEERREFVDSIERELSEQYTDFDQVFVEFDRFFEDFFSPRILRNFFKPLPRRYEFLRGDRKGKYCPYCGEELKKDYRYCPGCGKKV
jgi:hypothetical protein